MKEKITFNKLPKTEFDGIYKQIDKQARKLPGTVVFVHIHELPDGKLERVTAINDQPENEITFDMAAEVIDVLIERRASFADVYVSTEAGDALMKTACKTIDRAIGESIDKWEGGQDE